jgi:hypothetical protein
MMSSGVTCNAFDGSHDVYRKQVTALGEVYATLGRFDGALRCIDTAGTVIETTAARWNGPGVHSIRFSGEMALVTGAGRGEREGLFRAALTVTRQQQAKSWKMRAAMSMARLYRQQGKRDAPAICSLRSTAGSQRLRHARSERGEGVAGGVGVTPKLSAQLRQRRLDPPECTAGIQ